MLSDMSRALPSIMLSMIFFLETLLDSYAIIFYSCVYIDDDVNLSSDVSRSSFITTVKVEPLPSVEATLMSPPKAYARFLLRVRPSPQPILLSSLLSMIFFIGLNRSLSISFLIPTPVSYTSTKYTLLSSNPACIFTSPSTVYFMALESRLIIICLSLL